MRKWHVYCIFTVVLCILAAATPCMAASAETASPESDCIYAARSYSADSRICEGAMPLQNGRAVGNPDAERQNESVTKWLLISGAALILILSTALIMLAVRIRRYQRDSRQNENIDRSTGIGNKHYFTVQFKKIIANQNSDRYFAAFIGFDIAKVNQYYGEPEAEMQLRFATSELMSSNADSTIIARVSGGGFAVLRKADGEQEITAWAEKLIMRLNRYTEKYGRDYHPDFRMGIYMLRSSDRDGEQVLYNAHRGYTHAVRSDLPYAFSRADQLKRESDALELKKQLNNAMQNREIRMFLQFIVSANDGRVIGAEALSRWEHPKKGLLYPNSYVELMESDKTIAELDFYIFEEVCRRLENWKKQEIGLSISCNFARVTIDNEGFIPHLQKITDRFNFDKSKLVIEITEDAMENNKETAFANISKCKEMGFRIALDDAGSGYTSFSDLRDYPIDIVKIDRSILTSAVNPRGIALLKGMIALIQSLQMKVLCEGVEKAEQEKLLRQLGCDYMQGHYYYRALPADEADRTFKEKEIH